MSKSQERPLSDFELWMMKSGRANKDFEFTIGDDQEYIYSHVAEDFSVWCAAVASMSPASSEQKAAQQDAERWRAFSQGAVFPKLSFNNGNSHWQYGELRGLSANAVADLLIAARASNGGKA